VQEGDDSGPARRQTQQQGITVGLPPKHPSCRTPDWAGRPDCETAGRAYLIVGGHRAQRGGDHALVGLRNPLQQVLGEMNATALRPELLVLLLQELELSDEVSDTLRSSVPVRC